MEDPSFQTKEMSAGAPTNVAQKNLIDKVAQYVSKNGSQFENMMREKQRGNPEYAFLFPNGAYNKYYLSKVRSEQIAQKVQFSNEKHVLLVRFSWQCNETQ